MACTNCGDGDNIDEYTVRFTKNEGEPTEMDLTLCGACVSEFRTEPGIELS